MATTTPKLGLAVPATSSNDWADAMDTNLYTIDAAAGTQVDWNLGSGLHSILHKPVLATVATTGNYGDLGGKPTLPATKTPVSHQFVTGYDAGTGLLTTAQPASADVTGLATVATSGSYTDLINKPAALPPFASEGLVAGSGTTYTLAHTPTLIIGIFIAGTLQRTPTDYTAAGAVITFTFSTGGPVNALYFY